MDRKPLAEWWHETMADAVEKIKHIKVHDDKGVGCSVGYAGANCVEFARANLYSQLPAMSRIRDEGTTGVMPGMGFMPEMMHSYGIPDIDTARDLAMENVAKNWSVPPSSMLQLLVAQGRIENRGVPVDAYLNPLMNRKERRAEKKRQRNKKK